MHKPLGTSLSLSSKNNGQMASSTLIIVPTEQSDRDFRVFTRSGPTPDIPRIKNDNRNRRPSLLLKRHGVRYTALWPSRNMFTYSCYYYQSQNTNTEQIKCGENGLGSSGNTHVIESISMPASATSPMNISILDLEP